MSFIFLNQHRLCNIIFPSLNLLSMSLISFGAEIQNKNPKGLSPKSNSIATTELGIQFLRNGEYQKCKTTFKNLTKSEPDNPTHWFNLANCEFMLGDYESAQNHYQKVIDNGSPLALPSRVYISKIYRMQGKLIAAIKLLRDVQSNPMLVSVLKLEIESDLNKIRLELFTKALNNYQEKFYDEALEQVELCSAIRMDSAATVLKGLILLQKANKKEALAHLQSIKVLSPRGTFQNELRNLYQILEKQNSRPGYFWSFFFEGTLGYDSNVQHTPLSESNSVASMPTFKGLLAADVLILGRTHFHARGGYSFGLDEVISWPELRFSYHRFSIPVIASIENQHLRFLFSPYFDYYLTGAKALAMRPGVSIRLAFVEKNSDFGITVGYAQNLPRNENYEYLRGSSRVLSPYYSCLIQNLTLKLYYSFVQEKIHDIIFSDSSRLPMAYQGHILGIESSYKLSQYSKLTGGVDYSALQFENHAEPIGTERLDWQISPFLKLSKNLTETIQISLASALSVHRSSLVFDSGFDRNYNQLLAWVGLSTELLSEKPIR